MVGVVEADVRPNVSVFAADGGGGAADELASYAVHMLQAATRSQHVHRLVAFAHVASVSRSMGFYGLLGFTPQSVLRDETQEPFWAMLRSGGAELMLARASGTIDAGQQAVLFYMYSAHVTALRTHLLASGMHDGGRYEGQAGPNGGRRVVFEVASPHYMPDGEMRVVDDDGYVILVGQMDDAAEGDQSPRVTT